MSGTPRMFEESVSGGTPRMFTTGEAPVLFDAMPGTFDETPGTFDDAETPE